MTNSKQLGFIGIDQYGQRYEINKFPRKELLQQLYRKHANKMYCDTKDGKVKHIGYIIAGLWISIFRVYEWKKAV